MPLSSKKFLVLILSTSEGWKAKHEKYFFFCRIAVHLTANLSWRMYWNDSNYNSSVPFVNTDDPKSLWVICNKLLFSVYNNDIYRRSFLKWSSRFLFFHSIFKWFIFIHYTTFAVFVVPVGPYFPKPSSGSLSQIKRGNRKMSSNRGNGHELNMTLHPSLVDSAKVS